MARAWLRQSKKAWQNPEWRNVVDKLILAVVRQAWNDLQDMQAGYEPGRPKACFERESFELCFQIFSPLCKDILLLICKVMTGFYLTRTGVILVMMAFSQDAYWAIVCNSSVGRH